QRRQSELHRSRVDTLGRQVVVDRNATRQGLRVHFGVAIGAQADVHGRRARRRGGDTGVRDTTSQPQRVIGRNDGRQGTRRSGRPAQRNGVRAIAGRHVVQPCTTRGGGERRQVGAVHGNRDVGGADDVVTGRTGQRAVVVDVADAVGTGQGVFGDV